MRVKDFDRIFNDKNYSDMVDFLNSLIQSGITLDDNMSGEVIRDIELPADGTEIKIPHRLKAVPKYRIILRQVGAGIVIDGGEWTDRFITLSAKSKEISSIVFPGGTYAVDLIAETTAIPSTNCTINYSSEPIKVTILLMRG